MLSLAARLRLVVAVAAAAAAAAVREGLPAVPQQRMCLKRTRTLLCIWAWLEAVKPQTLNL